MNLIITNPSTSTVVGIITLFVTTAGLVVALGAINDWYRQVNYSFMLNMRSKAVSEISSVRNNLHICFGSSFDIDIQKELNTDQRFNHLDSRVKSQFLFFYHSYTYSTYALRNWRSAWDFASILKPESRDKFRPLMIELFEIISIAQRRSSFIFNDDSHPSDEEFREYSIYILDKDRSKRNEIDDIVDNIIKFVLSVQKAEIIEFAEPF